METGKKCYVILLGFFLKLYTHGLREIFGIIIIKGNFFIKLQLRLQFRPYFLTNTTQFEFGAILNNSDWLNLFSLAQLSLNIFKMMAFCVKYQVEIVILVVI